MGWSVGVRVRMGASLRGPPAPLRPRVMRLTTSEVHAVGRFLFAVATARLLLGGGVNSCLGTDFCGLRDATGCFVANCSDLREATEPMSGSFFRSRLGDELTKLELSVLGRGLAGTLPIGTGGGGGR